ncbi:MAG: hypothetical protein IPM69_14900 [Ignavibacteria bacterium]|nr:hypothetical protein [Ignavibacteria bacterium]
MNQALATDVPTWLKNVLLKINWNGLNFVLRKAIKEIVHSNCYVLPQKGGETFYTIAFTTDAPTEIIDSINYVDFNSMTSSKQQEFKTKIEKAVKTYLGVQV